MSKRIEKEIELYKELFNKAISVTILVGAGTVAIWHKEGFSLCTALGVVATYFSLLVVGVTLRKWWEKINSLEG